MGVGVVLFVYCTANMISSHVGVVKHTSEADYVIFNMIYKEYKLVIDTRISHTPRCKRNQRFRWSITRALGKPMA